LREQLRELRPILFRPGGALLLQHGNLVFLSDR
jgi:hypothetical protein